MKIKNISEALRRIFGGKNKARIAAVLLIFVAMPLFSGCGQQATQGYTVNLEIWGLFDDSADYAEVINQYKKINPYVGEIKYRKLSPDTYKQDILDALASGQGPDIFLINNAWLPSFKNKLEPAPTPLASEQDVKTNFPDVVADNFVDGGKVYALPLSVDSLQLYYNKAKFNAAGITEPPKTWQQFSDDVRKLTVVDRVGSIVQSGAAFGTAQNINRASDILATLMMQNGVEMPNKAGMLAKFDQGIIGPDGNVLQAGEQALGFYTQFARLGANTTQSAAINPLYTWNTRQHNSLDAFAEESAAMTFNYSWQIANIKNKNPKLNFAVAPIPQAYPDKPVTYANYWGYAVTRNKLAAATTIAGTQQEAVPNEVRTHEAWQFLRFLTLKNSGTITLYNAVTKNSKDFAINFDPAMDYLKKSPQPAARRDLIDMQKNDQVFGPFAAGNLIAKSWYQSDPDSVDKIFSDAIESVVRGDTDLHGALGLMKNRINYTVQSSSARGL